MELFKCSVAFLVLVLASDVLARPSVFGDLSNGSAGRVLDPLGVFRSDGIGRGDSVTANLAPAGGLLGISATVSRPGVASHNLDPVGPSVFSNTASRSYYYSNYGGSNGADRFAGGLL